MMHKVIFARLPTLQIAPNKKGSKLHKRCDASRSPDVAFFSFSLTMIWQEAEYLERLESIERDCRKVPPLLLRLAARRGKTAVSPEVILLLSMVEAIAWRCGRERETIGLWREDGLDPDEVIEEIEDELEKVVKALNATFPAGRP
jgi:hypothetical protein